MTKNRLIGVILVLIGGSFLYMTTQLPVSKYSTTIGAKVFPFIGAGGLALCGIGLFFKRETEKEKKEGPFLTKEGWIRTLKLVILLFSFPLMFQYLGFVISSMILLYIMISMFDLSKEEPVWKKMLASFSVTAVLYVLFIYIIKIKLPLGELIELII